MLLLPSVHACPTCSSCHANQHAGNCNLAFSDPNYTGISATLSCARSYSPLGVSTRLFPDLHQSFFLTSILFFHAGLLMPVLPQLGREHFKLRNPIWKTRSHTRSSTNVLFLPGDRFFSGLHSKFHFLLPFGFPRLTPSSISDFFPL